MKYERKQQRIFIAGFILIIFVIAWFLLKPFIFESVGEKNKREEQKSSEEIARASSISAQDLFKKIKDKSKIFILDVNNASDFGRGHIETSINVETDKANMEVFNLPGIQKTSDIVVVGRGDDLESTASLVNRLVDSGFVNCKYLQGGVSGWKDLGYPLISSGVSGENSSKVKRISIADIEKESEMNLDAIQFLDVRSKSDFSREHIVRAVNVPLVEIETRKGEIPAAKKIIVYGGNENESYQAASILFDLNFFSVYQMEGGIKEWKNAGGNTQ